MNDFGEYMICNFDKMGEPKLWISNKKDEEYNREFKFENNNIKMAYPKLFNKLTTKTDRFTDALIYMLSILPAPKREDSLGKYKIVRTDQRFHPHYRGKIYRQNNSFCADLPYGYLNLYANSQLTLSNRVHSCAVTLAFGHSAMLFSKTDRLGLLGRVGANDICEKPVKLDLEYVKSEKEKMVQWITNILKEVK